MRGDGSGANLTARDSARNDAPLRHSCCIASPRHARPLPAAAQAPPRPPKPYAPVAITRPAASDDASFVAFRAALAAAAKSRIYAELAPLVLTQGFFWDRDFGQQFDPRKPAVDNLAAAIALEQGNGIGWDALAAFAAETAVEPLDSRPGVDLRAGAPGLRQRRVLQAARRHLYERHRLGLSARRRNAGARRAAAGRGHGRHARRAFRPPARLRGRRQRTGARPHPMGARRHAGRQAGLRRARQPDVADRRTALLHQGLGRRLADCRIYRRRKLDPKRSRDRTCNAATATYFDVDSIH